MPTPIKGIVALFVGGLVVSSLSIAEARRVYRPHDLRSGMKAKTKMRSVARPAFATPGFKRYDFAKTKIRSVARPAFATPGFKRYDFAYRQSVRNMQARKDFQAHRLGIRGRYTHKDLERASDRNKRAVEKRKAQGDDHIGPPAKIFPSNQP